jgi:hypothetical protein
MYSLTVNRKGELECNYEESRSECIRKFFNSSTYIYDRNVYLRNHDKFYFGCYKTEEECHQKMEEIKAGGDLHKCSL